MFGSSAPCLDRSHFQLHTRCTDLVSSFCTLSHLGFPLQAKQRLLKGRKLKDLKSLRHQHHFSSIIDTTPQGTTASLTAASTVTIKVTVTVSHPAQGTQSPQLLSFHWVPVKPPPDPWENPCVGTSQSVPTAPQKV